MDLWWLEVAVADDAMHTRHMALPGCIVCSVGSVPEGGSPGDIASVAREYLYLLITFSTFLSTRVPDIAEQNVPFCPPCCSCEHTSFLVFKSSHKKSGFIGARRVKQLCTKVTSQEGGERDPPHAAPLAWKHCTHGRFLKFCHTYKTYYYCDSFACSPEALPGVGQSSLVKYVYKGLKNVYLCIYSRRRYTKVSGRQADTWPSEPMVTIYRRKSQPAEHYFSSSRCT